MYPSSVQANNDLQQVASSSDLLRACVFVCVFLNSTLSYLFRLSRRCSQGKNCFTVDLHSVDIPFLSARSGSAERTHAYCSHTESLYVVTFGSETGGGGEGGH